MPLYEYQCTSCEKRFEVLRRLSQGTEDLACPECGCPEVEKEYSTFAGAVAGGGAGACGPSGRFT